MVSSVAFLAPMRTLKVLLVTGSSTEPTFTVSAVSSTSASFSSATATVLASFGAEGAAEEGWGAGGHGWG